MDEIKKIAKEFKQLNGNVNITQKEGLFYLITKVDYLVENKVSKKTFWIVVSAGAAVMMFLLREIINMKGGV